MKYRTLGKTNARVSVLGFGAMRLPTTGKEAEVIEPAAIEMIRQAIDHGVNYVDTAYVYHGGNSETVVGRALAGGYRQRVHLATKLPGWHLESIDDCRRILAEQLARLQTEQIDFYLLHSLQGKSWERLKELGVVRWAEEVRASGVIRHFGFSFHDNHEAFVQIIGDYDWSFCQIQYNYLDQQVQAGARGLQLAAARGLGVIVMEPLFGGGLANPPPPIAEILRAAGRDPVDLALRWLWNQPEVSLVLSGMSTLEQVRRNVEIAGRAEPGCLAAAEAALVDRVRAKYDEVLPIRCTRCGYCLPCPHGVNIPLNFELYNKTVMFGGSVAAGCRDFYAILGPRQAANCRQCGDCEERCPQQVPIGAAMTRVSAEMG